MNNNILKFNKIREVKNPTRGTSKSAGVDFYIPDYSREFMEVLFEKNKNEDESEFKIDYQIDANKFCIILKKRGNILIPSGLKTIIPENYSLLGFNKSSIASKKGLIIGACVIDEDYRGEIHINLINVSNHDVKIFFGEKIAQFILVPTIYSTIEIISDKNFKEYEITERGEDGFGSTNIKDK